MQFIRDNLTKAEEARRKGDTPNVYNSYSNLALYFQSNEVNDPKTGVYFYEKVRPHRIEIVSFLLHPPPRKPSNLTTPHHTVPGNLKTNRRQ